MPQFSPDGRWIAYGSMGAQNKPEIRVRPFPDVSSCELFSVDLAFS
jgi:hypothetical protein